MRVPLIAKKKAKALCFGLLVYHVFFAVIDKSTLSITLSSHGTIVVRYVVSTEWETFSEHLQPPQKYVQAAIAAKTDILIIMHSFALGISDPHYYDANISSIKE
jgi:hypothetical protein